MTAASIPDQISSLIPDARVLSGDGIDAYAVDGLRPLLAVLPSSIEDVAALLRFGGERGLAVTARGGGTLMDLGNLPQRVDLVLDLSRLNAITDYQPEDLVVTAQAGITLAALNARLAEHGQTLPLDPPLPERATLGGTLSANASGPSRLRFGTARDLVIGITCVLADGEIVHSGGRVVKNVAGYDMNKLYIGAFGTLGVIVEASFKLSPLASDGGALVAAFPSVDAACEAALGVVNSPCGPTAVEVAGPPIAQRLAAGSPEANAKPSGDWLVAVFVSGLPAQVERQTREIARILEAGGSRQVAALKHAPGERSFSRLRDYGRSAEDPSAVILRCAVLPSEVPEAVRRLEAAAGDVAWGGLIASPGAGLVRTFWSTAPPDFVSLLPRLRAALATLTGTVLVERCPAGLKRGLDVWGIEGADVGLMRDMKATFDPQGILNPGRYVAGI
jgi:glycolate oxidase FAD binding subunit